MGNISKQPNERYFRGIHALSIDEKSRLAVPTKQREGLGDQVVLTIDIEQKCLLLYPLAEWQAIEEKLQNLPSFNQQVRRMQRLLIGHATDVKIDKIGRLLLPKLLCDYADLGKQIVMVGQGNKFEIWRENLWQQKCQSWLLEETSVFEGLPEEIKTFSL